MYKIYGLNCVSLSSSFLPTPFEGRTPVLRFLLSNVAQCVLASAIIRTLLIVAHSESSFDFHIFHWAL
jgi:hypothetical protein